MFSRTRRREFHTRTLIPLHRAGGVRWLGSRNAIPHLCSGERPYISLNVPLDATRLASNSTRTTHPFYFHRWNELLTTLGIAGTVQNPYWNRTKGEMILECARPDILKATAGLSISCAKARARQVGGQQRASLRLLPPLHHPTRRLSQGSEDHGRPFQVSNGRSANSDLDSTNKKGEQYRGFEYAIERLRQDPTRTRSFIYKTGPLMEDLDKVEGLEGVYLRGMEEVAEFLKGIETISSEAET